MFNKQVLKGFMLSLLHSKNKSDDFKSPKAFGRVQIFIEIFDYEIWTALKSEELFSI